MHYLKPIFSMLCITIVATTALLIGLDGAIFFTAVVVLAGLGGYYIGRGRSR